MIQAYLYLEGYARTFTVGAAKEKELKITNMMAKNINL